MNGHPILLGSLIDDFFSGAKSYGWQKKHPHGTVVPHAWCINMVTRHVPLPSLQCEAGRPLSSSHLVSVK